MKVVGSHGIRYFDLLGRSTFGFFSQGDLLIQLKILNPGVMQNHVISYPGATKLSLLELPGTGGKLNILDLLQVIFYFVGW